MRRTGMYGRCFAFLLMTFAMILLTMPMNARADDEGGAVYVLGNQSGDNTVTVFHRVENGSLTWIGQVSTHGLGSGGANDPLGSQGALALGAAGHLLFAVNAGSNELSVLSIDEDGVRFADKASSGGERPISVTVHGNLAYVLNAGGTPNISGFFVSPSGRLHPISNSTRMLAGGAKAGPAGIRFSPDGGLLLVTEKSTNLIDIFAVDDDGRIFRETSQPSNNATPFGLSFGNDRNLIVSEAAGGTAGGSTVSSYTIHDEDADKDDLKTVSKSVPDTQTAACWIAVTGSGRLAFASNTASGTISSFNVARGGALSLAEGIAADLGAASGVIDMALSRGSRFLYILSAGDGTVTGFRISGSHLSKVMSAGGLPASIQGLAAE